MLGRPLAHLVSRGRVDADNALAEQSLGILDGRRGTALADQYAALGLARRCDRIRQVGEIVANMLALVEIGLIAFPFEGDIEPRELILVVEAREISRTDMLQHRPCLGVLAEINSQIEPVAGKTLLQRAPILLGALDTSQAGACVEEVKLDHLVDRLLERPDRLRRPSR